MMRRLVAALGVTALIALALPACAEETARALEIQSTPVQLNVGREQEPGIGKLKFRGALRLKSPDKDFGGISGIVVSQDRARFIAITDSSHWLTGELSYANDRLTAATGVEIAPLRDTKGVPLVDKGGDAEGFTVSNNGIAYVSFERDHRIWRYDMNNGGLAAKAEIVATPPELKKAPENGGLEGIALLNDGRLIAQTESWSDDQGNFIGWLIGMGKTPTFETLALKPRPPFEITDIRQLPNGDMLTLERRFSRIGGVGFEMRRIPGVSLKPKHGVMDGEVVANAGMTYIIDNMEGLSVNEGPNGETLVYIVSDDNFNAPLQQTLLMMFELTD